MPQKFTFHNPNGPEYVPCLGNQVVNPGDVVEFPDEFCDGLALPKWEPVALTPPPPPSE